jgi:hypothetical protein
MPSRAAASSHGRIAQVAVMGLKALNMTSTASSRGCSAAAILKASFSNAGNHFRQHASS